MRRRAESGIMQIGFRLQYAPAQEHTESMYQGEEDESSDLPRR